MNRKARRAIGALFLIPLILAVLFFLAFAEILDAVRHNKKEKGA